MTWIILGIGCAVVLLPLLLGALLPAREQVTRVELIKAPQTDVWDALSDLPRQTLWRTGLKSVQTLDDDAGLRWVEQPISGAAVTIRKVKEVPMQDLLLEMQQRGCKATRQARLNAVPGGTRITFTEVLEARSPLRRITNRLRGGVDRRLDGFIQQLRTKFTA